VDRICGSIIVAQVAQGHSDRQPTLFDDTPPSWVEVDLHSLRVERTAAFGGVWLGRQLLETLGLTTLFAEHMPCGREDIPWGIMAQLLIIARLLDPSSELHLAEHLFAHTAFAEVLGVPVDKVNDDRLYRALDALLPHKAAVTAHLKQRCGELFGLQYDLLLYDVTSTYFEGQAQKNPSAQRGYSRDHRPDCVQVCIAFIVEKSGFPIGYELFPGNRHDSTTVKTIVKLVEKIYGHADRIWVMDRGMISQGNLAFFRRSHRRYIIGTPKSMLKHFEQELLAKDWQTVHAGLEVKTCVDPDGSDERFLLCRSTARRQKEQAMHDRFARNILTGLEKIAAGCRSRKETVGTIERRVGKLLGANTRAAGGFHVTVTPRADGGAEVTWTTVEHWQEWATLSEGCYLLRTNVTDLAPDDLWTAYITLTQAESAFRIQKSDLQLRPVWHQRLDRVKAHIFVCFLAFVLWKTLGQLCKAAGIGDEPRRVLEELAQIMLVDVAVQTKTGVTIRKRCVAQPTKLQAELLHRLKLTLPKHLGITTGAGG